MYLSPRSYFSLLMTRSGLNTSSVQAGQDYTLPRGPLWPGIPVSVSCVRPPSPFPFRNRSAEQPKEQKAPFLPRSDKHDFHIVPCLSRSLCVFTSEHLPPVHCAREETGGKGGVSLHCFASHILPLSLAFLTCVQLVYPFPLSPALSLKNSTSSALFCQPCPAALCHPTARNESEECDHLAGLQAIVPGGPLSSPLSVLRAMFGFFPSTFISVKILITVSDQNVPFAVGPGVWPTLHLLKNICNNL